jgi:GxxExxY protein
MLFEEKTERIVEAFYKVYNTLGYGFLEKVYHNAMLIELDKMEFDWESEWPVKVFYDGNKVGDYYADILVDKCIILELKAKETLVKDDDYQLINYLKATDIEIGLLLNFGKKPQFVRKIFTNDRKPNLPKP